MDHDQIEEQQVIDRYLMGKLPEVEAALFEEHYMGCEQCLGELEQAQRMQGAARRAASEDASRVAATRGLAVVAWLARQGRSTQMAAAAMVCLVALLPTASLLRPSARLSTEENPPVGLARALEPQPGTPIISLRPERGSAATTGAPSLQLDRPSTPRWWVFSVELEAPLGAAYRIVLHRATGEELWRAVDVEPSATGQLNMSFNSGFFEDGDYLLVVDALTPAGKAVLVSRHPFRVVTGR